MNAMFHIYAVVFIAIIFFLLLVKFVEFKPTKYWIAKQCKLFNFFLKVDNIDEIPIREIEAMLEFLILVRCSEEDRIIVEVRNGYVLKFYPESVKPNKRWVESDYVEIYSKKIETTLRCSFSSNSEPQYQIERHQTKDSLEAIFFFSKQGKMKDFISHAYTTDGRREILENYRDFVIRDIM